MANLKDSTIATVSTTSHGTSANWKSAYDWGNHASAGYATTSAVNAKGDPISVTLDGSAIGKLSSIEVDTGEMIVTFLTTEDQRFKVQLIA